MRSLASRTRAAQSDAAATAEWTTALANCRDQASARSTTAREVHMATFVLLANFSDQGIRNVKDSTKRADAFKEQAQRLGGSVKDLYWTMGRYDIVAIVEAPDEKAMTTLGLTVGKLGNVRTETLRAFNKADMEAILSNVA
jgi:uncharacterized protein with GYD domain